MMEWESAVVFKSRGLRTANISNPVDIGHWYYKHLTPECKLCKLSNSQLDCILISKDFTSTKCNYSKQFATYGECTFVQKLPPGQSTCFFLMRAKHEARPDGKTRVASALLRKESWIP